MTHPIDFTVGNHAFFYDTTSAIMRQPQPVLEGALGATQASNAAIKRAGNSPSSGTSSVASEIAPSCAPLHASCLAVRRRDSHSTAACGSALQTVLSIDLD